MLLLPCDNCGSLTPTKHGIADPGPRLCHRCKQRAPSDADVAPASKPRKRKRGAPLAPAETYPVPKKRKK